MSSTPNLILNGTIVLFSCLNDAHLCLIERRKMGRVAGGADASCWLFVCTYRLARTQPILSATDTLT